MNIRLKTYEYYFYQIVTLYLLSTKEIKISRSHQYLIAYFLSLTYEKLKGCQAHRLSFFHYYIVHRIYNTFLILHLISVHQLTILALQSSHLYFNIDYFDVPGA